MRFYFNKLRLNVKGSSSSISIVLINRWRGLNRFCLLVGRVGVPVPQIINTVLCLQEVEGSIKGKGEIYNWEKIRNIGQICIIARLLLISLNIIIAYSVLITFSIWKNKIKMMKKLFWKFELQNNLSALLQW